MHWLMASSRSLVELVGSHNYLALFILILVEEAGCPLPLPGESLIVYAGSRIARGQMSVWRVFGAVVPASAIGCTILYLLAMTGGRALVRKVGPRIHFDEQKLDKFGAKATRIGPVAVLLGRITPGLRVPTDVAAGIFRIPFRYYLPFALTATCLRLAFFLYLGDRAQRVGQEIAFVRDAKFVTGVAIVLVALAAFTCWRHFRGRRRSALRAPTWTRPNPELQ